jgi:hypothetical protein
LGLTAATVASLWKFLHIIAKALSSSLRIFTCI